MYFTSILSKKKWNVPRPLILVFVVVVVVVVVDIVILTSNQTGADTTGLRLLLFSFLMVLY